METEFEAPLSFHIRAKAVFEMVDGLPHLLRIEVIDCIPIAVPAMKLGRPPPDGRMH